jgi:hypothetical protein
MEGSGAGGGAVSCESFMIHGLLASRIQTGLSDEDIVDDDVNIYISHLLCDYMRPQYHLRVREYVSAYDTSVFERVRTSTNARFKYTVYRANADHILMMMGVFDHPAGKQPPALAPILALDEGAHVGRGKAYYDYAFSYSRSLFGRGSGISDVLGKLAAGFERYLRLLAHLRGEYLDLIDRMSPGEIYHLEQGVHSQELARRRDAFLDAYADWRRAPTLENRERLAAAKQRLQQQDPGFRFELPQS